MTERGTVRTSMILIAAGKRVRVFQRMEQLPASLRRKLVKSTSGANAGTVLIADRRGAHELIRANAKALVEQPPERSGGFVALLREDFNQALQFMRAHWVLCCGGGVLAGVLWWALTSGIAR